MAPYGSDSDSNSDNEEDERMKQLLASWDEDNGDDSSDSDDDDDDEDEEEETPAGATKFDLGLEDNVLDHIVIAAPDFQEALKEFENMTGIKPSVVGSLRGLGTKSARVGLDNNAYIEIIAPDPKNSGPIGAALARELEEGTLVPYHYAIRSSEVADMKDDYVPNELGWQPDHISMFGASPDGTPKKWEMLYLYGHRIGGSLKALTVRAPAGHKVHDLLSSVKGLEIEEGEPMLEFSFGSPEGTITFSADNPVGVKFPGFEEGEAGAGAGADKDDYKFPGMPDLLPTSGGGGGDDASDAGSAPAADSDDDESAPADDESAADDDDDSVEVSDVEDSDED
ncbi:MAG: hypothetical protein SGARI_004365 [Bacillariaceae sp.]